MAADVDDAPDHTFDGDAGHGNAHPGAYVQLCSGGPYGQDESEPEAWIREAPHRTITHTTEQDTHQSKTE